MKNCSSFCFEVNDYIVSHLSEAEDLLKEYKKIYRFTDYRSFEGLYFAEELFKKIDKKINKLLNIKYNDRNYQRDKYFTLDSNMCLLSKRKKSLERYIRDHREYLEKFNLISDYKLFIKNLKEEERNMKVSSDPDLVVAAFGEFHLSKYFGRNYFTKDSKHKMYLDLFKDLLSAVEREYLAGEYRFEAEDIYDINYLTGKDRISLNIFNKICEIAADFNIEIIRGSKFRNN